MCIEWRLLKSALLVLLTVWLSACGQSDQELAENFELEGTAWQLVRIQSLNNYEWIPDEPGKYTLRFRDEGRLEGSSDCNRAGATWSREGTQLSLEQFITTRAMCPPGTLHNHFVSNLSNVNGFRLDDGRLILLTSIEGAWLEFDPLDGL